MILEGYRHNLSCLNLIFQCQRVPLSAKKIMCNFDITTPSPMHPQLCCPSSEINTVTNIHSYTFFLHACSNPTLTFPLHPNPSDPPTSSLLYLAQSTFFFVWADVAGADAAAVDLGKSLFASWARIYQRASTFHARWWRLSHQGAEAQGTRRFS